MQISYDREQNIAYIRFREKTEQVETLELNDDVHLDVAPDGTLYGIELLNANAQLGDPSILRIVNSSSGQQSEVELSA